MHRNTYRLRQVKPLHRLQKNIFAGFTLQLYPSLDDVVLKQPASEEMRIDMWKIPIEHGRVLITKRNGIFGVRRPSHDQ